MPFFRITAIIESSMENEDDLSEELVDRKVGKHKIVEVEEIELADDFDRLDDEDDDEEDSKSADKLPD